MIELGFLLLLRIAAITAGAPYPAPKPCVATVTAVTNFNPSQLAGTWYKVRHIFKTPELEESCGVAKYIANPDGTLKVDMSWVDAKSAKQKLSGTIKNAGTKPTDAKLSVTFGTKSAAYTIFYFEQHLLLGIYACVDNKADVMVFSRNQEALDPLLQDTVHAAMTKNGLKPIELTMTIQGEKCPAVV